MTLQELKKIKEEMSLKLIKMSTEEIITQSKQSKERYIKYQEDRKRQIENKSCSN